LRDSRQRPFVAPDASHRLRGVAAIIGNIQSVLVLETCMFTTAPARRTDPRA
jgi:hypothetical protein